MIVASSGDISEKCKARVKYVLNVLRYTESGDTFFQDMRP